MQENTNRAIAINSIITYAKLGINTILALFTTRFALQALGVLDYGLFSVLGSIVTFINIFNVIMISTCNRYLAVAIGKNDTVEISRVFNVNLLIFIGCAILLLIIAFPIGIWYISNYINYDGPITNAYFVFVFSVIGSVCSTLATPYNGLMTAKERFFMFSFVDVAMHVIRFAGVLALVYFFTEKLVIYTLLYALTISLPALIYWQYCRREFSEYVKWNLVRDKKLYTEVFTFSGWVAYGAFAVVARNQGAALLVNAFFNTVMNTALGIANSLNTYVSMFANSFTQPMMPQITKSYAAGNRQRTDELLIMATKFSFLLMLLVGTPFFVDAHWILGLWLGQVPQYAVSFTVLLIIDNLVMSFNSGLSVMLFASGKISLYQLLVNTLRLLSIVVAFYVLRSGTAPQALFITYISFSVIIVVATQWCLHRSLRYDAKPLFQQSYLPSLLTLLLFSPVLLLDINAHPLVRISIALIYLIIVEFTVGLSKKEKKIIMQKLKIKK